MMPSPIGLLVVLAAATSASPFAANSSVESVISKTPIVLSKDPSVAVSSRPPALAPSPSPLPPLIRFSTQNCTRKFSYTRTFGALRSTRLLLDAEFVGDGDQRNFPQFGMELKTHCNLIFIPEAPFDTVAVRVDRYRHICGNTLTFCLVDNATVGNIGRERPFFCGIQPRTHRLLNIGNRRDRRCGHVVENFLVPFSTPRGREAGRVGEDGTWTPAPMALVIQFLALHNPIEGAALSLSAHKRGEDEKTCVRGGREEKEVDGRKRTKRRKGGFREEKEEEATTEISEAKVDRSMEVDGRDYDAISPKASRSFQASPIEARRLDRRKRFDGFAFPEDPADAANDELMRLDAGVGVFAVDSTPRRLFDGFWCRRSRLCVRSDAVCDEFDSCLDGGSDEEDCNVETTTTTMTNATTMTTTTTMVPYVAIHGSGLKESRSEGEEKEKKEEEKEEEKTEGNNENEEKEKSAKIKDENPAFRFYPISGDVNKKTRMSGPVRAPTGEARMWFVAFVVVLAVTFLLFIVVLFLLLVPALRRRRRRAVTPAATVSPGGRGTGDDGDNDNNNRRDGEAEGSGRVLPNRVGRSARQENEGSIDGAGIGSSSANRSVDDAETRFAPAAKFRCYSVGGSVGGGGVAEFFHRVHGHSIRSGAKKYGKDGVSGDFESEAGCSDASGQGGYLIRGGRLAGRSNGRREDDDDFLSTTKTTTTTETTEGESLESAAGDAVSRGAAARGL